MRNKFKEKIKTELTVMYNKVDTTLSIEPNEYTKWGYPVLKHNNINTLVEFDKYLTDYKPEIGHLLFDKSLKKFYKIISIGSSKTGEQVCTIDKYDITILNPQVELDYNEKIRVMQDSRVVEDAAQKIIDDKNIADEKIVSDARKVEYNKYRAEKATNIKVGALRINVKNDMTNWNADRISSVIEKYDRLYPNLELIVTPDGMFNVEITEGFDNDITKEAE